jgi:hypothetical protein
VYFEDGIARRVIRNMAARGHELEPIGQKGELVMGYAAVAAVDPLRGEVVGGADPRRAHRAGSLADNN